MRRLPLLLAAATLAAPTLGLAGDAAPPARPLASGEVITIAPPLLRVISHEPRLYHGWPTVATARDGTLHLAYSGGRDWHVCPFGRVDYMVSRDGGATWSRPRTLLDSVTDDREAGIAQTRSGALLVSTYTSIAYRQHLEAPQRALAGVFGSELDATLARWRVAESRVTEDVRRADVGHWLLRSTDGGLTWSERRRAPGYAPHGPVPLADGRVFYAASDGKRSAAFLSSDDGLTWTHLADLPFRACELHAVEAADGTLVVHARDRPAPDGRGKQVTLQSRSRDGGRTWSAPQLVSPAYPSHLLRLRDGALLATFGRRETPFGIRAALSRDHGVSWSEEFALTTDGASWDLGYPATAQLADGSLVTIWYEVPRGSHLAVLRQAKWRL
ncbi:MAG: exo-alpha-sialidase [Opitutaceae bacterium]|nr:exo-alpha-sialidase [Opitutaceae bacterium]